VDRGTVSDLVKLGWRLQEIASAGEYRYGYADGDWPAQVHLDESVRPSYRGIHIVIKQEPH